MSRASLKTLKANIEAAGLRRQAPLSRKNDGEAKLSSSCSDAAADDDDNSGSSTDKRLSRRKRARKDFGEYYVTTATVTRKKAAAPRKKNKKQTVEVPSSADEGDASRRDETRAECENSLTGTIADFAEMGCTDLMLGWDLSKKVMAPIKAKDKPKGNKKGAAKKGAKAEDKVESIVRRKVAKDGGITMDFDLPGIDLRELVLDVFERLVEYEKYEVEYTLLRSLFEDESFEWHFWIASSHVYPWARPLKLSTYEMFNRDRNDKVYYELVQEINAKGPQRKVGLYMVSSDVGKAKANTSDHCYPQLALLRGRPENNNDSEDDEADDDDDIPSDEEHDEKVDQFIAQLESRYASIKGNKKVYVDPGDKKRFVRLTPERLKTWATCLVRGTPGVTLDNPPQTKLFEIETTADSVGMSSSEGAAGSFANFGNAFGRGLMAEMFGLTGFSSGNRNTSSNDTFRPSGLASTRSVSRPVSPSKVEFYLTEYLTFCGLKEPLLYATQQILEDNFYSTYEVLNSSVTTIIDVKSVGIKPGVARSLKINLTQGS